MTPRVECLSTRADLARILRGIRFLGLDARKVAEIGNGSRYSSIMYRVPSMHLAYLLIWEGGN